MAKACWHKTYLSLFAGGWAHSALTYAFLSSAWDLCTNAVDHVLHCLSLTPFPRPLQLLIVPTSVWSGQLQGVGGIPAIWFPQRFCYKDLGNWMKKGHIPALSPGYRPAGSPSQTPQQPRGDRETPCASLPQSCPGGTSLLPMRKEESLPNSKAQLVFCLWWMEIGFHYSQWIPCPPLPGMLWSL